jgi:nitrite reductase/ring-hydroxylating ferredoxin subunit
MGHSNPQGSGMSSETRVASVSDLADGRRVMVRIDQRDVFVFERDGRFYAFENVCRHMGGPVGEGILIGKVEAVLDDEQRLLHERFSTQEIHLVCPWHGWEYDIETGECAANRRIRLRRYEAVQRGEDVYVVA